MDKLRQWIALTLVAVLAVLAAGWFLLISPKRATAAGVRTQVTTTTDATDQLRTQLSLLKSQAKSLPVELTKLDAASAKIPAVIDMPSLLRVLSATAISAGVELSSIAPGVVTPVVSAVVAAPAATPSSGATDSSTAAPAPRVVAPVTGGAGTLNAVSITLAVTGPYFRIQQFLAALEDLPRAFRISGLTLAPGGAASGQPGTGGQLLTSSITGQVFVAVGRTPLPAAVVPGGSKPPVTGKPPAGKSPAGKSPAGSAPASSPPASSAPAGTALGGY